MTDHTPPTKGEADRQEAVDQANRREWWKNHNNLHLVAEWLRDTDDVWQVNLLDMLEKPWHWTDEFIAACEDEASEASEAERPVADIVAHRLQIPTVTVSYLNAEVDDLHWQGPFDQDEESADLDAIDSGEPVDEDIFRGDR